MFEVGKKYEIRMIIGGEETSIWRTVEKYEHPLLKFADVHHKPVGAKFESGRPPTGADEFLKERTLVGEIVNVTSPNFISAVAVSTKPNEFENL
jgi:hypothetical protein